MINADAQTVPVRYKSRMNLTLNLGVIVLTSILLIVFAAAIFGPTLKDAFSTPRGLPGGPGGDGLAGYAMKQNIWAVVVAYEQAWGCNNPRSTSIAIAQPPDGSGTWIENWVVNACGDTQIFKVRFAPDSNNNITFAISR